MDRQIVGSLLPESDAGLKKFRLGFLNRFQLFSNLKAFFTD